jgi:cytochrome c oxidase subunit 2
MTDGKERSITADEAYLRKSILEPNADVVKGFPPIMPSEKMTEDEIHELIQYIKELK